MTAEDVKKMLKLQPHPVEGGWFVRTYEAAETIAPDAFSDGRYAGPRRTGTAIYYLLEPDTFSEMHRLKSDEIFHFYIGDAVELLRLYSDGTGERIQSGFPCLTCWRLSIRTRSISILAGTSHA